MRKRIGGKKEKKNTEGEKESGMDKGRETGRCSVRVVTSVWLFVSWCIVLEAEEDSLS